MNALSNFHPQVQAWFGERFGSPTAVQEQSWPCIQAKKHVLVSAPTGGGKTLTAFLSAIDDFIQGRHFSGTTRILYVSPLKALNNDIQRNLLEPLQELKQRFEANAETLPQINVQVRSGDTSSSDRQRMLRRPPEILITTPESLTLLLTTVKGRQSLAEVEVVIIDEIHAVVSDRRGAQLMVCLERLVEIAGEFQRVALSATANPLERVASYVAGYDGRGRPRPIEILDVQQPKEIEIKVVFPPEAKKNLEMSAPIWTPLFEALHQELADSKSTLFFSNSRKQAEKVTLGINEQAGELVAYAHHGSLAREIRVEVEQRLKSGQLQAIVATNSLELGIDVGDLEKVVLIQSPQSLASAIQKIGRAGHRVGEISRCVIYPTHAQDFIDAAVVSEAVIERDLEPITPMIGPLDLLAQSVVSMTATEAWSKERLYQVLTRSAPYGDLSSEQFELVLQMLLGSFEDSRIRDLRPRLLEDPKDHTLKANRGATMAFYSSGGTIPNRGYYQLKTNDGEKVGELDEEFVWEAKAGQSFAFGTQSWTIDRITHNDVLVRPARSNVTDLPFWRSESYNRSFHFSQRIGEFLLDANQKISQGQEEALEDSLSTRGFNETAISQLVELLKQQRKTTGTDLPSIKHVLAEFVKSGPGGYHMPGVEGQLILHTYWGAPVNRPIAYAIEEHWLANLGSVPDIFVDNRVICIQMKGVRDPSVVLKFLDDIDLPSDLLKSLESKPFFAGRFRECAGRALLLSKSDFTRRVPLWMTRMQAQKIQTAVMKYPDFPILLETWRTCLEDEFDLEAANDCLAQLASGQIAMSVISRTTPSPFAAEITQSQINPYMYSEDRAERTTSSNLARELIQTAVANANLRPVIKPTTVVEVELRLQRRIEEYVPRDEAELVQWVRSRVWIPKSEWFAEIPIPDELHLLTVNNHKWIAHSDSLGLVDRDPKLGVERALRYYGPHTFSDFASLVPIAENELQEIIEALVEEGQLVDDVAIEESQTLAICDVENLRYVVRYQRRANRPSVEPIAFGSWTPLLAEWHRFGQPPTEDNIVDAMECLIDYGAPVPFWTADAWNCRFAGANVQEIYTILETYGLRWQGTGKQRVRVGVDPSSIDGLKTAKHEPIIQAFKDRSGGYEYLQLQLSSGLPPDEFNERFWTAAWDGLLSSKSLSSLQLAYENQFRITPFHQSPRSRARMLSKVSNVGWPGIWTLTSTQDSEELVEPTELELLEDAKDVCRQLLNRYGVLCREIVNREGREFSWASLFTALRIMELGEEIVSGVFLKEFGTPQFAVHSIIEPIRQKRFLLDPFWISAFDPIAATGLGHTHDRLPARRLGTHLGYSGANLVVVSESMGRNLSIYVDPEDSSLVELLKILPNALGNRNLVIEKVNGEDVLKCDYVDVISRTLSTYKDHKKIYLDSVVR